MNHMPLAKFHLGHARSPILAQSQVLPVGGSVRVAYTLASQCFRSRGKRGPGLNRQAVASMRNNATQAGGSETQIRDLEDHLLEQGSSEDGLWLAGGLVFLMGTLLPNLVAAQKFEQVQLRSHNH